jgi:hypothetical protein
LTPASRRGRRGCRSLSLGVVGRRLGSDGLFRTSRLCLTGLRLSRLCLTRLCLTGLCLTRLCLTGLCLSRLCLTGLCLSRLCLTRATGGWWLRGGGC